MVSHLPVNICFSLEILRDDGVLGRKKIMTSRILKCYRTSHFMEYLLISRVFPGRCLKERITFKTLDCKRNLKNRGKVSDLFPTHDRLIRFLRLRNLIFLKTASSHHELLNPLVSQGFNRILRRKAPFILVWNFRTFLRARLPSQPCLLSKTELV